MALETIENHLMTSSYHKSNPDISGNMMELLKQADGDITVWSEAEDGSGNGREVIEGASALDAKALIDARRGRLRTPEPRRKEEARLKDVFASESAGGSRQERHPSRERRPERSPERSRERSRERNRRERSPKEARRHRSREKRKGQKTAHRSEQDEPLALPAPAFSKAAGSSLAWPALALPPPSSAACSSLALPAASSAPCSSTDWVRLTKQERMGIHEAWQRVQRSTAHAARLAHQAGQAFDAEGINLEHCMLVVQRALLRADP